jgi:hypothetical protein
MDIYTAYRIAEGSAFQSRVRAYMVKSAIAILNGTPDSADLILGQKILDGGEPVFPWALGITTLDSVLAGGHDAEGASITDGTLATEVAALWAAFKK